VKRLRVPKKAATALPRSCSRPALASHHGPVSPAEHSFIPFALVLHLPKRNISIIHRTVRIKKRPVLLTVLIPPPTDFLYLPLWSTLASQLPQAQAAICNEESHLRSSLVAHQQPKLFKQPRPELANSRKYQGTARKGPPGIPYHFAFHRPPPPFKPQIPIYRVPVHQPH
jgi:hypothetical protein